MPRAWAIQLIPARGRKPFTRSLPVNELNSTHPRKGTETRTAPQPSLRFGNSTHPRKGTETFGQSYSAGSRSQFNSSPQGDGNRCEGGERVTVWKFNSSPQGDGNKSALADKANRGKFNSSPQGDGNASNVMRVTWGPQFNSSPQGDGNIALPDFVQTVTIQLIPARGRKLFAQGANHGSHGHEFNSSPQGDGNHGSIFISSSVFVIQLIPARGRKRFTGEFILLHYEFNSSPQGDGNVVDPLERGCEINSTHPRKGTETCRFYCTNRFGTNSTHPCKGTET